MARRSDGGSHKVLVRLLPVGFDEAVRKITSSLNNINASIAKSDKSLLSSVKNMERLVKQMEKVSASSQKFTKDTARVIKELEKAKVGKKIGEDMSREFKRHVKEHNARPRDAADIAKDVTRLFNRNASGLMISFGRKMQNSGNGAPTDEGVRKETKGGFMQTVGRLAIIAGAAGIIAHGVKSLVASFEAISPHLQAIFKILNVMATLVFLPFGMFIFTVFKPILLLMLRYMILPFAKFMGLQVKSFDDFNKSVDKALTGKEDFPIMELAEALAMAVGAALALFFLGGKFKDFAGGLFSGRGKGIFPGSGTSGVPAVSLSGCVELCRGTIDKLTGKIGTPSGVPTGGKNTTGLPAGNWLPALIGGGAAIAGGFLTGEWLKSLNKSAENTKENAEENIKLQKDIDTKISDEVRNVEQVSIAKDEMYADQRSKIKETIEKEKEKHKSVVENYAKFKANLGKELFESDDLAAQQTTAYNTKVKQIQDFVNEQTDLSMKQAQSYATQVRQIEDHVSLETGLANLRGESQQKIKKYADSRFVDETLFYMDEKANHELMMAHNKERMDNAQLLMMVANSAFSATGLSLANIGVKAGQTAATSTSALDDFATKFVDFAMDGGIKSVVSKAALTSMFLKIGATAAQAEEMSSAIDTKWQDVGVRGVSAAEGSGIANESVAFSWIGFSNELMPKVSEATANVARVAASISAIPSIPQYVPAVQNVVSGGGGGLSGTYSGSGHTARFVTNYGTLTGATATYAASVARGTVTRRYSGGFINEPISGIGLRSGREYSFGELGRKEIVIPEGGTVAGRSYGGTGPGASGNGGNVSVTVPLQVINANGMNEEQLAFKIERAIKNHIDHYGRI